MANEFRVGKQKIDNVGAFSLTEGGKVNPVEQNNTIVPIAEESSDGSNTKVDISGLNVNISEIEAAKGGKTADNVQIPNEKKENRSDKSNPKDTKDALNQRLDKVKSDLDKKVDENILLKKAWHGIKNKFGFGASSNKVEEALKVEQEKISQIEKPEIFEELTGVKYSEENYDKFLKGEIKLKSEQALAQYIEGQDGVDDFVGDMASGIVAVGVYSAAVAAAPITGGASIALGFGLATAAGAGVKAGIKAGSAKLSGKEYNSKNLKDDLITGGFSGALGPLTGGIGGAVGKSVATKLGIQAVKQGVKEIAKDTVKEAAKQGVKEIAKDTAVQAAKQGVKEVAKDVAQEGAQSWVKTALVNPTGFEYVGGNWVKQAASFGAEAMTDGALGGAIDGGFRAGYESGGDVDKIVEGTVQGGVGGLFMAPIIGSGFKLVGKAGRKFGEKLKGSEIADSAGTLAKSGDDVMPAAPNVKDNTLGKGGVIDNAAPTAKAGDEKLTKALEGDSVEAKKTNHISQTVSFEQDMHTILNKCNVKSTSNHYKEIIPLLNKESVSIIIKNNLLSLIENSDHQLLTLLDVIRRREHSLTSVKSAMKYKDNFYKMINTLEFKNFDKIKNITFDNFETLSLSERKEFINSIISCHYTIGKSFSDDLPDIKLFESLPKIKYPKIPDNIFNKVEWRKYQNNCKVLDMQLREQLDTIIYSLLEKIPRGKKALPPQKSIKIEEGCNLIPKPPLSNSIKSIPTKIEIIHGHNVEIGNLPNDKKVMIHGFSGSKLLFLEALMLTDADMNLCTGYKGGIGFKYSYELNLIVSPKSIKDLLIQSFEDASSDFGPVRNLYNLQHRYLQANGVENNYIPKLICEKLNIDMSEYNRRINALINNDIHYLEDIESIDKELFDAVTDITSNERLFEGIMRPNIEGIMIPAGFAISENLASFAERYDIKIFYGNI